MACGLYVETMPAGMFIFPAGIFILGRCIKVFPPRFFFFASQQFPGNGVA
jgi:hypothetical protein